MPYQVSGGRLEHDDYRDRFMHSRTAITYLKEGWGCMVSEAGLVQDILHITNTVAFCEWAVCPKLYNKVACILASLAVQA